MNTMSLFLHNEPVRADLYLTMAQVQCRMRTDLLMDTTMLGGSLGFICLGFWLDYLWRGCVCLFIFKFTLILFLLVQDSRVQHFGLTGALQAFSSHNGMRFGQFQKLLADIINYFSLFFFNQNAASALLLERGVMLLASFLQLRFYFCGIFVIPVAVLGSP